MTEAYLSFCIFCVEDFESFLLQFQFHQPIIHMLYDDMLNLLAKFDEKVHQKE